MMASDREQKLKIIDDAIAGIEKTYGKGSIMKLGDGVVVNDIEAIPTGALLKKTNSCQQELDKKNIT